MITIVVGFTPVDVYLVVKEMNFLARREPDLWDAARAGETS